MTSYSKTSRTPDRNPEPAPWKVNRKTDRKEVQRLEKELSPQIINICMACAEEAVNKRLHDFINLLAVSVEERGENELMHEYLPILSKVLSELEATSRNVRLASMGFKDAYDGEILTKNR